MEWLWEAARLGLSGLALVVSAWAWLYSRRAQRIAATEHKVETIEQRLRSVEHTVEYLPTHASWTDLNVGIGALRGDLSTAGAQIRGLGAGLKRVEHQISLLMENELRGKSQ